MRPVSWDKLRAEILKAYTPPLRAKATFFKMRQVLFEFPAKKVTDLSLEGVANYVLAHQNRSPATIKSLLTSLRIVARIAKSQGVLAFNPFDVRPPDRWVRTDVQPQAHKRLHRSAEQIGRFLDLLDREAARGGWKEGRLQALGYLYAFTGLRKMEALTLELEDIDLEARTLSIRPKANWRPKTLHSAATLPLALPLHEVLRLWLPRTGCQWVFPGVRLSGPWTQGAPGTKPLDQIRAAGERAGIEGLTILGFRKTIGTLGKTFGLGPLEVQKLLRHTSTKTQDLYDEADPETLRPAVNRFHFPRAKGAG
jgi:integrase